MAFVSVSLVGFDCTLYILLISHYIVVSTDMA